MHTFCWRGILQPFPIWASEPTICIYYIQKYIKTQNSYNACCLRKSHLAMEFSVTQMKLLQAKQWNRQSECNNLIGGASIRTWSRGNMPFTNVINSLGLTVILLQEGIKQKILRRVKDELYVLRSNASKTILQHGTKYNNPEEIKPAQTNGHSPLWTASFTA